MGARTKRDASGAPFLPIAAAIVVAFICSCSALGPHANYLACVSDDEPRRLTIEITIRNATGGTFDLRGHSPTDVMRIDGFTAMAADGKQLVWREVPETTRADGQPVQRARYRIAGPLPSVFIVRYRVSPGRREGDAHLGFTSRCFGYLGRNFAVLTGRDVFLLPDPPKAFRKIHVAFQLPRGWSAVTPWRAASAGFDLNGTQGGAAQALVASTIGLGRFDQRVFVEKGMRVRFAVPQPVVDREATERSIRALEHVVRYVRQTIGRDIGAEYVAVVAPQTPEGYDIAGAGWTRGQGRTLVPISTERLRLFAEDLLQVYLRFPDFRTEVRSPDEYWIVDALAALYSRRATESAGFASSAGIARGLAAGYLVAVSAQGAERNLEGRYTSGEGDRAARETIGPFILIMLDHQLRSEYGLAGGLDEIVPRLLARSRAPSLWSLLPGARSRWSAFRASFVRGAVFAPAPDLFAAPPTAAAPTPAGGAGVSRLTLVYTGNTDGYLENCGCKVNESGGVARRATVLDSLRRVDSDLVLLDAGNAFARPERFESPNALAQAEQRFYLTMMSRMGYRAATVGVGELARGSAALRMETAALGFPFLAANITSSDGSLGPAVVRMRAHGRWISAIGVFEPPMAGKSQLYLDAPLSRFTIGDPVAAVRREASRAEERGDLILVIGKLSPLTIRALTAEIPQVDLVISTDFALPRWLDRQGSRSHTILADDTPGFIGRTLVLYTSLGQYGLGIANVTLDRAGRIVGAQITDSWLTDRVQDQPSVRRALASFYDSVGVRPEMQASVRPPLASDPYWQGKPYAGAGACRGCHEAEHAQWASTPHASAFKTLLDKHRHYQPECVGCHVVGFGSPQGYKIGQGEAPLGNVQCEVCHGPGASHARAPATSNIRREVPERVCLECHNPDHTDRFDYARMLPRVRHGAEEVTSASQ